MAGDTELIERFKEGDEVAFEELLQKYERKVLATAYRYVRSDDLAKDIFQETFIRVYRSLHKFGFRSQFSTWLYRIVVNTCLTVAKREQKHGHASLDVEDDATADIPGTDDASMGGISAERRKAIRKAVSELPDQQKMVFVLRHYQGWKMREIATVMNLKEGTVKRYLFMAVQKLRLELGYMNEEESS